MIMGDEKAIWRIWVDTGGTFTDCLATDPAGNQHRVKVLSDGTLRARVVEWISSREIRFETQWEAPDDFATGCGFCLLDRDEAPIEIADHEAERRILRLKEPLPKPSPIGAMFEIRFLEEAPILAARLVTQTPRSRKLPPILMHLATTKGTNALLEQRGARTAFFVTQGFEDLLLIGTQQRPDLFAMKIVRPEPFYTVAIGVDERLDAEGHVVRPLDLTSLEQRVEQLVKEGFRTAAIALMHSYLNPVHERKLRDLLLDRGFHFVSVSTELAPFIKILPRSETSVVNAYLSPLMNEYLDRVNASIPGGTLRVMTSAGGLISCHAFHPKDSLLSGPAGGVVGAVTSAGAAGIHKMITFDMGGTSTDVSRFDGRYDYRFEQTVGGAHLFAPSLKIETVAAGGGSICGYGGNGLFVGPQSAGASPGPACYGAGGPLTITDVNLLLGRMDPSRFGIPVNPEKSKQRLDELRDRISRKTGKEISSEDLLGGFLNIANERMGETVRKISVREGYDSREYALTAFGGAGGQHACQVAEKLGITQIVFPSDAGLLSARGLQFSVVERFAERQILEPLTAIESRLETLMDEAAREAGDALVREGVNGEAFRIERRIFQMRLAGQESTEAVDFTEGESLRKAFQNRYRSIFGYYPEDKEIEVVSLRVVARGKTPSQPTESFTNRSTPKTGADTIRSWFDHHWHDAPVFNRTDLKYGDGIAGPAIVQDAYSTMVIDPGWHARMGSHGTLLLEKDRQAAASAAQHSEMVELELFTNRFRGIVEEMGSMLERTAVSTNVKERRDFSCALLDEKAELIVNAPHIPVHLGSLGMCVRTVLRHCKPAPGDMIVTNHPAFGGSHLPDVTVISPVYSRDGNRLLGYAANRAHHAEIGGIRPGSMSPEATCLAEEGVVIPPTWLFREGKSDFSTIERLLKNQPYPTRALEDNLADLKAQAASNLRGVALLQAMATRWGAQTVGHFCRLLKQRASDALTTKLSWIKSHILTAEQFLDDGTRLAVRIELKNQWLLFDFAGSEGVHPGNLNATPAIVTSVIIYFLRLLIQEPIPLNEGLLNNVNIKIPKGILNPPFPDDPREAPAVVGGNVETSQRLVDTLIRAFALSACSQGTMNNLIFGNDRVSYYETIGGGQGAGADFDGASAVHTHMTNTGITDPEILEQRYPVTLERFQIRHRSGGAGKYHGGDGVIREFTFHEPVSLSLLTQHRREDPFGLQGGADGTRGRQRLIRRSGRIETLDSIAQADLRPGDRFIIETPGGGGYGKETEEKGDVAARRWGETYIIA
jgi:5-oxoprolinase (ATP-hydrolysing)